MKKIKYNIFKLKTLLGAILALLGLSGCNKTPNLVEYGCPIVDLKINGTVKSPDGKGINGIRVIFNSIYPSSSITPFISKDTIYTNSTGNYLLEKRSYNFEKPQLQIIFEDIDKADNGGEFLQSTVSIKQEEYTQTKKASGWYQGAFQIKKDITLSKK